MPAFVILSEAKNLMDSGTYTSEILRLTPQNDVVGQPLKPVLCSDLLIKVEDKGIAVQAKEKAFPVQFTK